MQEEEKEWEIYTVTKIDLENLPFSYDEIVKAIQELATQIQEEIQIGQQLRAVQSQQLQSQLQQLPQNILDQHMMPDQTLDQNNNQSSAQ